MAAMRRHRRALERQRGVVLIMVLAGLALITVVAASFARRIDDLRQQTMTLRDEAHQRLQAGNAITAALYFVATRQIGAAGFGPMLDPELRADGRSYTLPDGGWVKVQDDRGLYPVNAPERLSLMQLLTAAEVPRQQADSMVDVLQDYLDTDSLKRLNGAEAQEYALLGLPPPRNDWMISLRELQGMPLWRDQTKALAWVQLFGSVVRRPLLNPNTAPLEVLRAFLPAASPAQLELLLSLRQRVPFLSGEAAQRITGLPVAGDNYAFHLGPDLRITSGGAGAVRGLQYNVILTPGGVDAPWLISSVQSVTRAEPRDAFDSATPFPLAFAPIPKP